MFFTLNFPANWSSLLLLDWLIFLFSWLHEDKWKRWTYMCVIIIIRMMWWWCWWVAVILQKTYDDVSNSYHDYPPIFIIWRPADDNLLSSHLSDQKSLIPPSESSASLVILWASWWWWPDKVSGKKRRDGGCWKWYTDKSCRCVYQTWFTLTHMSFLLNLLILKLPEGTLWSGSSQIFALWEEGRDDQTKYFLKV